MGARKDERQDVRSVVKTEGGVHEWRELLNRTVTFIPAGLPFEWEWTYYSHAIHLLLSPEALNRVAGQIAARPFKGEEAFPQLCYPRPLCRRPVGASGAQM